MLRTVWIGALLALLVLGAAIAHAMFAAAPGARTFHVDFAKGSDSNDGSSPARAFRRAPGDPEATGRAGAVTLRAGDGVIFAPGVVYRGAIVVSESGTPRAPIRFEGAAGGVPAIIDGGDPLSVVPCPDAASCGGAAQWQRLSLIRLTTDLRDGDALFANDGPLYPAQDPDPADPFYRDEVADMREVNAAAVSAGMVDIGPAAAGLGPLSPTGPRLALWVKPNLVKHRPILALNGTVARFDPAGLSFYDNRPGRFAVVNSLSAINRPREYAVLPSGRGAVAWLSPGVTSVNIARGRGGFDLRGASHVTISNLTFRNFADGGEQFGGVAIFSNRRGNTGVRVEDNRFVNMVMSRGQGPIILRGASGLTITGNTIGGIFGSGMRITGPSADVTIRDNRIRQIARSAIVLMNVTDALVEGNLIADVRGVHGNGLTAYLANQRVRFIGNTVVDAKQAVTFHGNKAAPVDNSLEFANNLLIGTDDAIGVLISWGALTRNVSIHDNIVLGGRYGLRLNPKDTGLVVQRNHGTPMVITGDAPVGWNVQANDWSPPDRMEIDQIRSWAMRQGVQGAPPATPTIMRYCARQGAAGAARRIGATGACR